VQYKSILAMIFNEIKCHVNTSLGLVGGCIPCILSFGAHRSDLAPGELCPLLPPSRYALAHVVLILFLLVRATWVLFFTHIPFMLNRTFTTMLTERLQGWARFLK